MKFILRTTHGERANTCVYMLVCWYLSKQQLNPLESEICRFLSAYPVHCPVEMQNYYYLTAAQPLSLYTLKTGSCSLPSQWDEAKIER